VDETLRTTRAAFTGGLRDRLTIRHLFSVLRGVRATVLGLFPLRSPGLAGFHDEVLPVN
jgi:hypothetical protein